MRRSGIRAAGVLLCGLLAPASGAEGQRPAPPGPIPLDTIPVTGSRVSASLPVETREVQVLDRAAIAAIPARTLADVLRWGLGLEVAARSPAQADLSLRGAGFEQVLVLVDGKRMSDAQTGHFDLNLAVPLDRIERIEILRGPASALYGSDAVGGVVNVITRDDVRWTARVERGSFETTRAAFHGGVRSGGGISLETAAEWGRSDGHREGTDWDQRIGSLALRAPLGGGRLHAEAGEGRRAFGADGFYAPFPSHETTRARTASVGWRSGALRPGGAGPVRIEPRVSWRRHEDDFILVRDDPAFFLSEHVSERLGGELVAHARIASGVVVALGGEAFRDRLRSSNLGDLEEERWAAFGELGWSEPGAYDLSLGIRHDEHQRWGGFTSPSAALAVDAGRGVRVRASWGRSFRGPSWTELRYEDPAHRGRPDIEPERSEAWEAGFSWRDGEEFELRTAAFRRTSTDLIDWTRPAGFDAIWETRNVAEARFEGLEATARWRLDRTTTLTIGGSWLSAEAELEEGVESKYVLRPLVDQLTVALDRRLADGALVSIRGLQGRRKGEETFHEVDLRLELPVWEGAVYLDVRNATDRGHADLTGHPVAGRAFYVGYRVGWP